MAKRTQKTPAKVGDGIGLEDRLKSVVDQFNKMNKESEIKMVTDDYDYNIPSLSFGSLAVDIASGIGGMPQGRIIEIFGNPSGGKTTLTLHAIAATQKAGGIAAFVDAEMALDLGYAKTLGVDTEKLLITQPNSGEEALDAVETLSGLLGYGDIIVIDSVAALTPKKEIEGDMGDQFMGLHARLMSQACRKLVSVSGKSGVTIVFINQIRNKIGVVYGSNETVTGGQALSFYSSQRVEVKRTSSIKNTSGDVIGNAVRVKFVKNKVAPPLREANSIIYFGNGFSVTWEIFNMAVNLGLIEKSGSWYSYNGESIGQGDANASTFLDEDLEVREALVDKIKEVYFK